MDVEVFVFIEMEQQLRISDVFAETIANGTKRILENQGFIPIFSPATIGVQVSAGGDMYDVAFHTRGLQRDPGGSGSRVGNPSRCNVARHPRGESQESGV